MVGPLFQGGTHMKQVLISLAVVSMTVWSCGSTSTEDGGTGGGTATGGGSGTCVDTCTTGASICDPAGVRSCTTNASGCKVFGGASPCPSAS